MDVNTGDTKLVVDLDTVYKLQAVPEDYKNEKLWFNHVVFSRDGKRIFFLARLELNGMNRITAAFTVGLDGSDLRCVLPYEWGASHFDWLDGEHMVVTSKYEAGKKWYHVFLKDGAAMDTYIVLAGEHMQVDGHCHFSYDGKWMVTDSYPSGDARYRGLYLYNMETESFAMMMQLHEPRNFRGMWRCDLHPRWSAAGDQILLDSSHDGTRQLLMVNLTMPE